MTVSRKTLLFIIEQGGYRVHADRLAAAGYEIATATSMRKALAQLKTLRPAVVVAELNPSPRIHDRISNLETLFAQLQAGNTTARLVVLLDRQHDSYLERLRGQYPIAEALHFPFEAEDLLAAVSRAAGDG